MYYQDILGNNKYGTCEGYVVNTKAENLKNWLTSCGVDDELVKEIRKQIKRIAIIKSIYVDDGQRGQGIGSSLLNSFISEAELNGADAIILECGLGESNFFDLQKWYESYCFEVIYDATTNPIMLLIL